MSESSGALLQRQGYALAERFYGVAEVARMRETLEDYRRRNRNPTPAEARALLEVLFNERLLALSADLLGGQPVVFADIQINAVDFWSRYGWHKDSVDRHDPSGPDWQASPYPVLRFGTYFQDYAKHSGAVAMQAGSHLGVQPDLPGHRLAMAPGDLGYWYLTTNHSANTPSFRCCPDWAPVPPANRLLNRLSYLGLQVLDRWPLTRPRHDMRQVVFFAIGKAGEPLARYLSYLLHRRYFFAASASLEQGNPLAFLSARGFHVLDLAPLRAQVDPGEVFKDYDQARAARAAEALKLPILEAMGLR